MGKKGELLMCEWGAVWAKILEMEKVQDASVSKLAGLQSDIKRFGRTEESTHWHCEYCNKVLTADEGLTVKKAVDLSGWPWAIRVGDAVRTGERYCDAECAAKGCEKVARNEGGKQDAKQ